MKTFLERVKWHFLRPSWVCQGDSWKIAILKAFGTLTLKCTRTKPIITRLWHLTAIPALAEDLPPFGPRKGVRLKMSVFSIYSIYSIVRICIPSQNLIFFEIPLILKILKNKSAGYKFYIETKKSYIMSKLLEFLKKFKKIYRS